MNKHLEITSSELREIQIANYPNWDRYGDAIISVTVHWRTPINPSTYFIPRINKKCKGYFINIDYTRYDDLFTMFCFQYNIDALTFVSYYENKLIITDKNVSDEQIEEFNSKPNALVIWLKGEL